MIKVVLASEKDIPRIYEIEQEAISPPWSLGALMGEIEKDSFFIVAVDDAPIDDALIVGFAILRQVGDDGELLQIAVDKSLRQSGVGDLLMAEIQEHASTKAFNSVFLEVRRSNAAAIALYKKHGFKQVRVRKDYYEDPVEDALIMVKSIII